MKTEQRELTVSARDRERAVAAIAGRLEHKEGVHIGLRPAKSVQVGAQEQPAILVTAEHKDLPDLRKEFLEAVERARWAWPEETEYELIESADYLPKDEEKDTHLAAGVTGVFKKARVLASFLLSPEAEPA